MEFEDEKQVLIEQVEYSERHFVVETKQRQDTTKRLERELEEIKRREELWV